MAGIEIVNVTKRFGTNLVVDNVSLEIRDKEFVTLLGPSGCGKTTTLRMLAGFLQPDAGEIRVGGQVISTGEWMLPPEKRHMGMVFQNYAVWPHMNVFQNVAFGLEMQKIDRKQIKARVETGLELVGLAGLGDRYPAQLSGGQQQRVALARALVVEPTILLLDEPLSNLDAKLREQMRFTLKELQRRTGITFVYVTHDQAEAMAMSDRVAVIQHGKVQQYAPPSDVYRRPANKLVADFMGLVNLLPGTVERRDSSGQALVRVADDWLVTATVAEGVQPNTKVTLVARPEDISLVPPSRAQEDEASSVGTVTQLTFLGNFTDYRVEKAGRELRIQAANTLGFGEGDKVGMRIDPAACFALNE
ncbi:MAG: ABC transporter ATP-binding protein [Chloroflexota bacterium]